DRMEGIGYDAPEPNTPAPRPHRACRSRPSARGVDGAQDLACRRADAIGFRPVDPADDADAVEKERRREEDVAPRASAQRGAPPRGRERGHAVDVADAERVHQRASLIGEKADRQVQLVAQALRDVRRIDAHRDDLDAAIEDRLVVLAELAELRDTEGAPGPPVEEDQQAAPGPGAQREARAVGPRPGA